MLLLILLSSLREAASINIAVKSKFTLCPSKSGINSMKLVDGNLHELAHSIAELCRDDAIVCDLTEFYYLHYIVVYGGEIMRNDQIHFGTTLHVNKGAKGLRSTCGRYLKRNKFIFRGMIVNCEKPYAETSSIWITSAHVKLYLTEIEIHTFASGIAGEREMVYRGCFSSFFAFGNHSVYSPKECSDECTKFFYILAAIKGTACYCGKTVDANTELSEEHCDCVTSDHKCGGVDAYSVYLTQVQLPYLKDCASGNHESQYQSKDMTVTKCIQLCDKHLLALVKNGSHCTCANETSEFSIINLDLCDAPCSGDPNSYCGGPNQWSVYGTCLNKLQDSMPCSKLFFCSQFWDEFGICHGGCREGYIGEHCLERELKLKVSAPNPCTNSEPCKNETNSYCSYNHLSSSLSCICKEGYSDMVTWKICQDIDECEYDLCDTETTVCKNQIGSYTCTCMSGFRQLTAHVCEDSGNTTSIWHATHYETQRGSQLISTLSHPLTNFSDPSLPNHPFSSTQSLCTYDERLRKCFCKDGYQKNDNDICEDIDECMYDICNNKTSTCENRMGSFVCKCNRDYFQISADVCITNPTAEYAGVSHKLIVVVMLVCFLLLNFLLTLCYGWNIGKSDKSDNSLQNLQG